VEDNLETQAYDLFVGAHILDPMAAVEKRGHAHCAHTSVVPGAVGYHEVGVELGIPARDCKWPVSAALHHAIYGPCTHFESTVPGTQLVVDGLMKQVFLEIGWERTSGRHIRYERIANTHHVVQLVRQGVRQEWLGCKKGSCYGQSVQRWEVVKAHPEDCS